MSGNKKKIEKLNVEYAKNDEKIARLMERQQEIEKQRTELENLDILGMVRGLGLSFAELTELINGEVKPVKAEEEAPLEENPEAAAAELSEEVNAAYAAATEEYATGDYAGEGGIWNG